MYEKYGHNRSGSGTRPATVLAETSASDMSNLLKKYKIVILGEQSSKKWRGGRELKVLIEFFVACF